MAESGQPMAGSESAVGSAQARFSWWLARSVDRSSLSGRTEGRKRLLGGRGVDGPLLLSRPSLSCVL